MQRETDVPLFQPRYEVNIGNDLVLKRPDTKSIRSDGQHSARWRKDVPNLGLSRVLITVISGNAG